MYFSDKIMQWGAKHLRSFPWRSYITPYRAMISEILLQRTHATNVGKVFPKFIKKYPDIMTFVNFREDELYNIIEPLGLYKNKLKYFKEIRLALKKYFNYKIPNNFEDLVALSGVNIYIANAILCFAYNERVPIVDTNVKRIFQRFFNYKIEKSDLRYEKKIWDLAEKLLPLSNYKTYNYAILDFGGLLCKKRKPKCFECQLSEKCEFYKKDREN